ncbi:YbaN family protein [Devosia sediminis]|uniref:YbaN family protein n=1 Tax=Devosia sediminis TaxID=2798801 RepID=A0A934J1V7_9HYPH|nr:YbaN family protein [Devosia sediminis]MBJ3786718.1 YbaN family protein [Devosia sediminis]
MLRPAYFVLGCLLVALGIIGAFVPLMPTTSFLILAAWCFARSSRRAEAWLLNHKRFGPAIRAWRESGAIARRHKLYSLGGMTLGFAMFWFTAKPDWWLALLVAAVLLAIAAFVVTRPEPVQPQS